jgi:hypothetical protein
MVLLKVYLRLNLKIMQNNINRKLHLHVTVTSKSTLPI